MREYNQTLYVEDNVIKRYNSLMIPGIGVNYEKENIDSYSTVRTWFIKFPNDTEMDIKICAGAKCANEPLWAEGSLFQSGEEVTFTYPKDRLDTTFTCKINVDDSEKQASYTVTILPESRRNIN